MSLRIICRNAKHLQQIRWSTMQLQVRTVLILGVNTVSLHNQMFQIRPSSTTLTRLREGVSEVSAHNNGFGPWANVAAGES